jgi:putative spermidine/putrescine transport system substrate-binding protein
MPTRRSFLWGAGSLTLAALNSGCNAAQPSLRISLLQNSIPPQLINQFRQQIAQRENIVFRPEPTLEDLLKRLQQWHQQGSNPIANSPWQLPLLRSKPPSVDDLVTLGDAWLATAIQEKLLQPIALKQLSGWQNLPPSWQEIGQRDMTGKPSLTGQIWGAPYRWGTTLIAYRQDKFKTLGWQPQDWADLWKPELRDRISLIDQPREVIGLTLKKLGYSYNTTNLEDISQLNTQLKLLHQQVKFYSSDYYLQPLVLGDTWLAVGWSNEILPLLANNPNIKAVIPRSGTALWADLWVKPASTRSNPSSLVEQWIDFCWQPQSAQAISLFTKGISPVILTQPSEKVPQVIRENPLLFVAPEILDKSEFILPLTPESSKKYQDLWLEIRQSSLSPN